MFKHLLAWIRKDKAVVKADAAKDAPKLKVVGSVIVALPLAAAEVLSGGIGGADD